MMTNIPLLDEPPIKEKIIKITTPKGFFKILGFVLCGENKHNFELLGHSGWLKTYECRTCHTLVEVWIDVKGVNDDDIDKIFFKTDNDRSK